MSAYGSSDTARQAVDSGAYDFIAKPFRTDEIELAWIALLLLNGWSARTEFLRQRVEQGEELAGFIGRDPVTQQVMEMVRRVADSSSTVLIIGDSGTGKGAIGSCIAYCHRGDETTLFR